jgi:hypothetical protein
MRTEEAKERSLPDRKAAVTAAVLALMLLSLSAVSCTAHAESTSFLAPSWMKEGTYASYTFPFSQGYSSTDGVSSPYTAADLQFLNNSLHEFRTPVSEVLRWECIQLNVDRATLNVSLSIITETSDNFYASALVDVDTASRSVYLQNGTLIGTTRMWMPSSPADGQEVVFWDLPPDKTTANVTNSYGGDTTVYKTSNQGVQRTFMLTNMAGKIDGQDTSTINNLFSYEYDTGLFLYGTVQREPLLKALGIADTLQTAKFDNTNVDFGPESLVINWNYVLSIAAIAGSIVIVAVMMLRRRLKRK